MPLNWRLVPDELEFILADSGTRVLVFGHEFVEAVRDLQARPRLRGEGDGATRIVHYVQVGGETASYNFV